MTGIAARLRASTGACALHRVHRPAPLTLVTHHVVPKAMGGGNELGNRAEVCDTGHRSVHVILAALVFGLPAPGGTRSERAMAVEGYRRWLDLGRPGNPHAAFAVHAGEV